MTVTTSPRPAASVDPGSSSRTVPLDMGPDEFRRLGHRLVDDVADLLAGLRGRPAAPGRSADDVRAALNASAALPETGTSADRVLQEATTLLREHSTFNGHPRFMAYITAGAAPIGVLGDLLAAAINPNVGGWALSPMATEIESQTVRWIAELIGYPAQCGGLMVSGGNMANMVAFFAARARHADWDVRREGATRVAGGRLRAYVSAETHTWVQKAADLAGLGTDAVRWIPTASDLTLDLDALRAQIRSDRDAGDLPFLVVGTAGSVSTGAVDPLPELAEVCRDEGLWFHVDGAYGGFAAADPDAPDALRGLALADSVAVDPHKWLYAPLEAGCVLVRDPAALPATFSYHPDYYEFDHEVINYFDLGPQNSRGFRALKVWLALRHAGRRGYVDMIRDDMRLSRLLAQAVIEHPDLDLVTQALSITTFRYVPPSLRGERSAAEEAYVDRLNEEVRDRLERGGEVFVSNALVGGRYLLRACIVNFRTTEADVLAVPEIVARVARAVDREWAVD